MKSMKSMLKSARRSTDSAKKPSPGLVSGRKKRPEAADLRHDVPRYPAFLDIAGAWAALRVREGVGLEDIQP